MAKKNKRLRKNLSNIFNVGTVGMSGGVAWKGAGVLRMGATGVDPVIPRKKKRKK